MRTLVIDNYDSFVFNLVDELERLGCDVRVERNDIPVEAALGILRETPGPSLLVLSPGPGTPAGAGCCVPLLRAIPPRQPVFGVCLGHQTLIEALGGEVGRAPGIVHGKASPVLHDGTGIFSGLPSPMPAGRYHSLVGASIPKELRVTAWTGETVMAVEHERRPMASVQFHPESILTPHGSALIANVVERVREVKR